MLEVRDVRKSFDGFLAVGGVSLKVERGLQLKKVGNQIMTLLGGMGTFYGPAIGALVLILLNQQITAYTEYWPFVLGTILVILLFVFPGGLAGAAQAAARRLWRPRRA